MSYFPADTAPCSPCAGAVEQRLIAGTTDLREFAVRRALPAANPARFGEARARWAAGGFDRIDGDDEFIPLPR